MPAGRLGLAATAEQDHEVRVLSTLTSLETFDTLAGPDKEIAAAIPDILRLAEAAPRLG